MHMRMCRWKWSWLRPLGRPTPKPHLAEVLTIAETELAPGPSRIGSTRTSAGRRKGAAVIIRGRHVEGSTKTVGYVG